MDPNRRRKQLQAYFAGVFDGEGSVGVYLNRQPCGRAYYYVKVQVKMSTAEIPGLLWREYPEGLLELREQRSERHAHCWEFILNGQNAYRFLQEIKPFVILKDQQVRLALTFLAIQQRYVRTTGQRGGEHTAIADRDDSYVHRAEIIHAKMKVLNQRGPRGVNSVNLVGRGLREYRAKQEVVAEDERIINLRLDKAREGWKTRGNGTRRRRELLEGVETRHSGQPRVEATSAPEKEIVQEASAS
jgi:hypothetical protein